MLFIAALVVMAQVDGGTEPSVDAGIESSLQPVDAGAEWALPPMVPFAPDPEEPDAGVPEVVKPPVVVAEPKLFDAAARLSLIIDRMQLSEGDAAPILNANVIAARKFGRWSVGTDILVNVQTANIVPQDQGTNLWASFHPGSDARNFLRLSVHPLGAQRLRIGEGPLSYGGDLVEPVTFGNVPGLGEVSGPRPATAARLDARFGHFAGYGWVQTTVRMNPEINDERRQFAAAVGLRALNVLGVDIGGDVVRAPHGWTPATTSATGSTNAGTATSFEAYRLFVSQPTIPPPVDFQWEARNPQRHLVFFADDDLVSGVHFGGNTEVSLISQELITGAGGTAGSAVSVVERVYVVVYGGRVSAQFARLRVHLGLLSRPPEYFLLENLSNGSYALPFAETRQDERSARLTLEWVFGPGLPRVGLGGGWIQPAARKFPGRTAFGTTVPAVWLKYKEVDVVEETTSQPDPITELRATMSWQVHELAAIACELKYQNDPTRTELRFAPGSGFSPGGLRYLSDDHEQVYASMILQVRL